MAFVKRERKFEPSGGGSRSGSGGGDYGGRRERSPRGPRGSRMNRKKQNRFPIIFPGGESEVNFRDTDKLAKFLTEKGKIIPRRITGLTAKQQRILARAIKCARHAGLIAFQVE